MKKSQRIDKARKHLALRIVEMIPDDGRACYYLGSAYDKKGMSCEAARYYPIYLELLHHDANCQKVAIRLRKMEAAP